MGEVFSVQFSVFRAEAWVFVAGEARSERVFRAENGKLNH
jgi:hypothetical protein